jgi:hypothetical protein
MWYIFYHNERKEGKEGGKKKGLKVKKEGRPEMQKELVWSCFLHYPRLLNVKVVTSAHFPLPPRLRHSKDRCCKP